jgi:hypothetical protein
LPDGLPGIGRMETDAYIKCTPAQGTKKIEHELTIQFQDRVFIDYCG